MKIPVAVISLSLLVAYADRAVSQTVGNSSSTSSSLAVATGVQAAGTGGSATGGSAEAAGGASAGGSAAAVSNFERPTPPAYAPSMPATTPCYVGLGAGASGGTFSVSLGGYVEDTKCTEREDLRLALMSGDPELIGIAKARFANRIRAGLHETSETRQAAPSRKSIDSSESGPFGY